MAKYVGGDGCHIGFDDTEVNEDESSDKVSLPEEARHVEEKAKDARPGAHPPSRRVHVHLK